MAESDRQRDILAYLNEHETISVKEICEKFYVSEATARRDLTALEKTGAIRRIFGGATLIVGSDKQVPLFVRERENAQEKIRICEKASKLIRDGNVLFIDGSSTAQFLVEKLTSFNDLIVITNGLKIAEKLAKIHVKVYLTGGLLMENSSVLIGFDAEKFVEGFNADICFLSCKGVSDDGKLTDTSYFETQLRKKFLQNSKTKVMLITKHKFGKTYAHTLTTTDEIDYVITDD